MKGFCIMWKKIVKLFRRDRAVIVCKVPVQAYFYQPELPMK